MSLKLDMVVCPNAVLLKENNILPCSIKSMHPSAPALPLLHAVHVHRAFPELSVVGIKALGADIRAQRIS